MLLELSLCGIDYSDAMYKGFNFILNNGDRSEVKCINQMKEYMIEFKNEEIWMKRELTIPRQTLSSHFTS